MPPKRKLTTRVLGKLPKNPKLQQSQVFNAGSNTDETPAAPIPTSLPVVAEVKEPEIINPTPEAVPVEVTPTISEVSIVSPAVKVIGVDAEVEALNTAPALDIMGLDSPDMIEKVSAVPVFDGEYDDIEAIKQKRSTPTGIDEETMNALLTNTMDATFKKYHDSYSSDVNTLRTLVDERFNHIMSSMKNYSTPASTPKRSTSEEVDLLAKQISSSRYASSHNDFGFHN